MAIDLDNLSDEVLFYSHDQFYNFIEEYLGVDEMKLIKLQSIKSSKTLINVPDVLAILSFKCREMTDLKHRLCFIDDDNPENFVVKSGIKTGITDLIKALKEKNLKHAKRKKYSKSSSTLSSVPSSNADQISSNTSKCNSIELQPTPVVSTAPQPKSIDTYMQLISDRIETFCLSTFQTLILTNNHDYIIYLNESGSEINGSIKCGCNTTIKIIFRSESNSFQLSAYFKHLKNSRCSMMTKKKKAVNKTVQIADNSLDGTSQEKDYSNVGDEEDYDEEHFIYSDDSPRTTTQDSNANCSNSVQRKRSLPIPTTSNNKKKIKSQ